MRHHCKQHLERWEEYQAADDAVKKAFFEEQLPLKGSLNGFFGKNTIEKIFMINTPISSVIIGEIMWDSRDVEG